MQANELEYRILSFLRNREMYLKYAPVIKENLFESKEVKYIYKLITYYHRHTKGKTLAPINSLFTLLSEKIGEKDQTTYKKIIRKIKSHPFTDETIADGIVKRFAKRALMKITVMDILHSLDTEEDIQVDKLRSRFDEALTIDSTELVDNAYDYLTNPAKRLEDDRNEERLATLLSKDLDNAMRRGLAAGEIGIVVAPTGVGKTVFLINLAYNAMRQGKKALYITLELSGRKISGRFDQRVSRKSIQYIENHPNVVYNSIKKLRKLGGGLFVKDWTSDRLSPNILGIYLERLRKTFEFDVIIIDQADLMHSPKEFKERRYELSSIIIALRRLGATYGCPVWTASQATRLAGAEGKTTLWDIAEDIGKAQWADIVVTLSQDEEDKKDKIMFLDLAKNRIGEGNPRVILDVNLATMTLKEATKPKDEDNE